jgi:hypothetical protein
VKGDDYRAHIQGLYDRHRDYLTEPVLGRNGEARPPGAPAIAARLRIPAEQARQLVRLRNGPAAPIRAEANALPTDDVAALVAARVAASARPRADRHTRTVHLDPEPIGLLVLGDPHVDDEGCDWATLHRHVEIARATPGVLAACVGDMHNNWIGRLARLYADSPVTAEQGWQLSGWLLGQLQWIAICGGNHDAWSNGPGVDPLAWLTERCGVLCYAPDEIRITLDFGAEVEPVVWVLRHDFAGRSWFHPTHGPHKEAMLDGRAELYTAGHIHQWGALSTEHRHGRVTHALRVRGYKRHDSYAREKGFHEQEHGEAVLVVIDPRAAAPGRITVWWDIEAGCRYLTGLREERVTAA